MGYIYPVRLGNILLTDSTHSWKYIAAVNSQFGQIATFYNYQLINAHDGYTFNLKSVKSGLP